MGSLVDPSYELIDPTPDVHALFCQFDTRFFDGRLAACEVKWSPRMTTCAGICCYEGRSGLCSIKLSTPLLKLRPRKDLVETLLHEMIHAFLFVTVRDRDRDGHGPQFKWHMDRINREAGTRITIYHSFHAEVAVYKNHHWRCEGSCRDRRPFFGWVKRASNRAPSKNDLWWSDHEKNCGGKFVKVSEPKEFTEKKEKAEQKKAEGGGEKKRGGAKGKEGGVKPVDSNPKQPRIDSVFGGGEGGGMKLGGADGKASTSGGREGGSGGQMLGGGGTGRSRLLDLYGGGSTVDKRNRSIEEDDEITVVEVIEVTKKKEKEERPRLRGGSQSTPANEDEDDPTSDLSDHSYDGYDDDFYFNYDDLDENEPILGGSLRGLARKSSSGPISHEIAPRQTELADRENLQQSLSHSDASAQRKMELKEIEKKMEKIGMDIAQQFDYGNDDECNRLMVALAEMENRQNFLLSEETAWQLHEDDRKNEEEEREKKMRKEGMETEKEDQRYMGKAPTLTKAILPNGQEVIVGRKGKVVWSSKKQDEMDAQSEAKNGRSAAGSDDKKKEKKEREEEIEEEEVKMEPNANRERTRKRDTRMSIEDTDDSYWASTADEGEMDEAMEGGEEEEKGEVEMEEVTIVRRHTQTFDMPIEQWIMLPSLPREGAPVYEKLTTMERKKPIVKKAWRKKAEEWRRKHRPEDTEDEVEMMEEEEVEPKKDEKKKVVKKEKCTIEEDGSARPTKEVTVVKEEEKKEGGGNNKKTGWWEAKREKKMEEEGEAKKTKKTDMSFWQPMKGKKNKKKESTPPTQQQQSLTRDGMKEEEEETDATTGEKGVHSLPQEDVDNGEQEQQDDEGMEGVEEMYEDGKNEEGGGGDVDMFTADIGAGRKIPKITKSKGKKECDLKLGWAGSKAVAVIEAGDASGGERVQENAQSLASDDDDRSTTSSHPPPKHARRGC